jgi:hypothetical protein
MLGQSATAVQPSEARRTGLANTFAEGLARNGRTGPAVAANLLILATPQLLPRSVPLAR